jgi:hypothetical protein
VRRAVLLAEDMVGMDLGDVLIGLLLWLLLLVLRYANVGVR